MLTDTVKDILVIIHGLVYVRVKVDNLTYRYNCSRLKGEFVKCKS